MSIKLLMVFIALNVFNVVIQTVKSIVTIKCNKVAAAIVNAVAYGLYTIVLVYTMCDLPLYTKALIVALCNLVGVFLVKLGEEKAHKDKLWKVEFTIPVSIASDFAKALNDLELSFSEVSTNSDTYVYNVFCKTQKESALTKTVADRFNAKYFVSESKTL